MKDKARDCDHGRMKGKCEVCDLQSELDATNRQVEILSDALAESRLEVAALKSVQEPVFELQKTGWEIICDLDWIQTLPFGTKLYTIPPAAERQWVGLTDEDIQSIHDTYHKRMGPMEFARAIEVKLREMNNG
jgi:hypothetical protein